ncbi:beta-galactosidase domain 4-containing protein [Streptomyces sp. M10(2022)]
MAADRTPHPGLLELKKVYQPVEVSAADLAAGTVKVRNKHLFSGLDAYELRWTVTRDGHRVQHGTLAAPETAPGTEETVRIPLRKPEPPEPGAEYWLNVSFVLKSDTRWAETGHTVAAEQLALNWHAPPPRIRVPAPCPLSP